MKLYAIYDRATETYGPVHTQATDASMRRLTGDEANNPQSKLAQHPTDYELWSLGEFNEQTGEITPKVERIARIEDLIAKTEA